MAATGAPTYEGTFGGLSGSKNGTNGLRVSGIYLDINGTYLDDSDDLYYVSLVSADGLEQYMPCNSDMEPTDNYIMRVSNKPTGDSTLVRSSWNQYVNQYATSAGFFSYNNARSLLSGLGMLEYDDLWGRYEISDKLKNTKYSNLINLGYKYYLGGSYICRWK